MMKQQDWVMKKDGSMVKKGRHNTGFIMVFVFPIFLMTLILGTILAGNLSYSICGLSHRNEVLQGYSLLEDDGLEWKTNVLLENNREMISRDYEPIVLTRNIGPYVLLVKEFRNKNTGRRLVNRMEFMPIEKEDDCG